MKIIHFFYINEHVETNEQSDVSEKAFEVFDDDDNHQCQVDEAEEYGNKEVHENSGVTPTKEMSLKQNAVWSKNATLTLLSLYEANLHKVNHKNKKTQLWTTISADLDSFDIKMSPDQVRWKIDNLQLDVVYFHLLNILIKEITRCLHYHCYVSNCHLMQCYSIHSNCHCL